MDKYPSARKCLAVGIILLFIGTCIIPSIAQDTGEPSLLTSSGNWLYVGGSGLGNYTRIQDAVNNASNGDTVFVYHGSYSENVDIDKIINLIGEDKNTTIIDGGGKHDVICIHNDNDGVTISGFTIEHSGNFTDGNYIDCGIDVLSNNNTIQNNIISYNPLNGIRIGLAKGNSITRNIIINNLNQGLYIVFSSNNSIVNNIISNNTFCGINLDDGDENRISNNTISSNFFGITISVWSSGVDNIISSNDFLNNSYGIFVKKSKNYIYQNNFINNLYSNAQVQSSRCVWDGNYWDDWVGLKSSAYRLFPKHIKFGLNYDWHPAYQPYEINSICHASYKTTLKEGYRNDNLTNTALVKKSVFCISSKPIPIDIPTSFSWRDYNGKDFTTPAKNQKHVGNCWAFAACGALESVIKIRENRSELNPDLSEQYLVSCLPKIREEWNVRPFFWIMNTSADGNYCNGVPIESCFPYVEHYEVPPSHIHPNWKDYLVPISDFGYWIPDGTSRENRQIIKTLIMEKGPVTATIEFQFLFRKWGYSHHSPTDYYPHIPSIWRLRGTWAGLHIIVLVGWKDIPLIPSGGYWICKNSWGTGFGYDGFFNLAYGSLGIGEVIYPISPIYTPYIGWVDYNPGSYDW
jgi:parallel beta-helix repeat protein